MKPRHPESGMVYCCPACESCGFQSRIERDPRYRCRCGHEFDDPDERRSENGQHGLSATLQETDPEDLGLTPAGEVP